jgi:hypothetical protein
MEDQVRNFLEDNWGDVRAVPLLKGLADSRYPEVVEAAHWSLAKLGS